MSCERHTIAVKGNYKLIDVNYGGQRMDYNYEKERQEAIDAGNRALFSLRAAQGQLNSAKNWGVVDLLGGGLITSMIKRSKMDDAQRYMEEAKRDLQTFSNELRDVSQSISLDFNSGDFLRFADYFFDGLVADWLVQDRIHNARQQVDEAIRRVEQILRQL